MLKILTQIVFIISLVIAACIVTPILLSIQLGKSMVKEIVSEEKKK